MRVDADAGKGELAHIGLADDDGTGVSFIVKGSQDGIASTVQAKPWEVVYPALDPAPAGVATRLAAVERAIANARDGSSAMNSRRWASPQTSTSSAP